MQITMANLKDLEDIKAIADNNKIELGFLIRSAIKESILEERLCVSKNGGEIIGFIRFRHRKDNVTKIYDMCVRKENRRQNHGKKIIDFLKAHSRCKGKTEIQLKCPENLDANNFYRKTGFELIRIEEGKKRRLKIWRLKL